MQNENKNTVESNTGSNAQYIGPQTCSSSASMKWISSGFAMFKKDIRMWILTIVFGLLIALAMSAIPVLGTLASMLLTYVWMGGLMLGCQAVHEGKSFDVKYLFAGFSQGLVQLVLLSALLSLATLMVFYLAIGPNYFEILANANDVAPELTDEMAKEFMLKLLLAMLFLLPVFMAAWFAPALIVLQKMPVMLAMKESINGCLKNTLPFLFYGLALLAMYIIAIIPMMLGLLIVLPVIVTSVYCSYRDIYLTKADDNHTTYMQMDA